MNITPAGLQLLFQGLKLDFQAGYTSAQTTYEKFTTRVPSSAREEHYGWMDKLPMLREWLGERVVENVVAQEYTLKNRKWEKSYAVKREDLADERMAMYSMGVKMLGEQTRLHPDVLTAQVVEAGATSLTFDNANFFSPSHPIDTANAALGLQSNLFNVANGGAMAMNAPNVAAGRSSMRLFKGRDNQVFGVNPTHIMGPPNLEQHMAQICAMQKIAPAGAFGINAAGGFQDNPLQGTLQYIVNERLTSTTAWYLMDLSHAIRPFVFQDRESPEFTYMVNPNDPNVWKLDQFEYGVRARYNVGYGLWFFCAKFDSV